MTEKADRFRARKAITAANSGRQSLALLPPLVGGVTGRAGVDTAFLDELRRLDSPVDLEVTQAEVQDLLKRLASADDANRLDQLLADCKTSVLQSIAGPFGLGAVVAKYDKDGGNVDTVHNNRDGVFATEEAREKVESRGDYSDKENVSSKYHQDAGYRDVNKGVSKEFKGDGAGVQDGYRDASLKKSQGDEVNLDHIRSAHDIHNDAGVYLADLDPRKLAGTPENLTPTSRAINNFKGKLTTEEFLAKLERTRTDRRQRIADLKAKSDLTPQEAKKLKDLQELEQVDPAKVKQKGKESDASIDGQVNGYYKSAKFAKNVVKTSAQEAGKMAFQQAIGAALSEFFLAAIDEIGEWNRTGRGLAKLGERLKAIGDRVVGKWKEVMSAAAHGAVAGLLSNLSIVLINILVTTERRLVRMIREGFMSLVRAVKVLLFRPEGTTFAEAAHAATKIAFAGGIVIGGVIIEELIAKQLEALGLSFIAGFATAVIVGSVTGIVTAMVVHGLDKLDLFGVEAQAKLERIQQSLDEDIEASEASCEAMLLELDSQLALLAAP